MCGRFYIDPDDMSDEELLALLDREKSLSEDSALSIGEVQPGQSAAVIALNRRMNRHAFVMRWGYRFDKKLIFNARSETAHEKSMFSASTAVRRCLIPASAYFEWDHRQKPYVKYRFHVPERKMIYLAGLYRFEQDTQQPAFTILTRQATEELSCFHDRMPVIIPASMTDTWLDQAQDYRELITHAHTEIAWTGAPA